LAARVHTAAAKVVGTGRDHNQYGFSVWLAGTGLACGFRRPLTQRQGSPALVLLC
jgi:hypothetical protein